MKRMFLVILVLPTLVSCGSNSSGGDNPNERLRKDINYTGEFSDFGKLISEQASLECGEASCPEGVVSIYTEASKKLSYSGYEYSMQLCSGTLIAPDLILTNFHCIEKTHGTAMDDCKGKVYVRTQDGETVGCKEITYDSSISFISEEEGIVRRDVALIRLDHDLSLNTPDAIMKVVPKPLSETEAYSSYVVNFGSTFSEPAKIAKKTCKIMKDNSIYPLGGLERKSFEFLGDCDVIQGNSGSALLSEKNEIVGLIFARIQFDKIEEAWDGLLGKLNHKLTYDTFNDLHAGLAVSFACLNSPAVEEFDWSVDGDTCPDRLSKADQSSYFQETILSIDDLIIQYVREDSRSDFEKYFRFKVDRDSDGVYALPSCFESKLYKKDFPDAEDLEVLSDLRLKRSVDAKFEVDATNYKFKINDDNSYLSLKSDKYFVKSDDLGFDSGTYSSGSIIVLDCKQ